MQALCKQNEGKAERMSFFLVEFLGIGFLGIGFLGIGYLGILVEQNFLLDIVHLRILAAGIVLLSSCAGIAMGLIKEGDDFAVLTDILIIHSGYTRNYTTIHTFFTQAFINN